MEEKWRKSQLSNTDEAGSFTVTQVNQQMMTDDDEDDPADATENSAQNCMFEDDINQLDRGEGVRMNLHSLDS